MTLPSLSDIEAARGQIVMEAIRCLFLRHRVVAEGAGAVSLACALKGKIERGKTVCVISGGNIDADKLIQVLNTVS